MKLGPLSTSPGQPRKINGRSRPILQCHAPSKPPRAMQEARLTSHATRGERTAAALVQFRTWDLRVRAVVDRHTREQQGRQ